MVLLLLSVFDGGRAMKAACFILTNLHARGLDALKANHLPKENNGVRRVTGGEGAGGRERFLGWGNQWD